MTYRETFSRSLEILYAAHCGHACLVDVFQEISASWNYRDVTSGPGFSSGVTKVGCPFEFSVSLSRNRAPKTRFIADPGIQTSREEVGMILSRCAGMPCRIFGIELPQSLQNVFAMLRANYRGGPGQHAIWIGAEQDGAAISGLKYYFNPCVFSTDRLSLISQLASTCGLGSSFMTAIVDVEKKCRPLFHELGGVGIDLSTNGAIELKLYYWRRENLPDKLAEVISRYSLRSDEMLQVLEFTKHRSGKLLACFQYCQNAKQLRLGKLDFRSESFFDTDLELLSWVRCTVGDFEPNKRVIDCLLENAGKTGGKYRLTTYLSIGARDVTVYFMPLLGTGISFLSS